MAQKKLAFTKIGTNVGGRKMKPLPREGVTMNVFIKYHGKTVGPYGVGGFQSLNFQNTQSDVKTLVMKAAQEDGSLPYNSLLADMVFVFENTEFQPYANC